MSTIVYNCPRCGAPLHYQAASGKLCCEACESCFEAEALEAMNQPQEGGGLHFDLPTQGFGMREARRMRSYSCQSCGAELMTEETTTATECPYCGSPTILPEQIEGGVKPELVVPFTVTREEAQAQFEAYFKGKHLLPNVFLNSRNRIAQMRKLYVPYWLFDCDAYADIVYKAEKRHVERRGEWEITRTEHYIVRRSGSMSFENIPVDGSEKLDNTITESLEPYDLSAAVPFTPAVLAGAMADHADVDSEQCESRVRERVENSITQAMYSTVTGYNSVDVHGKQIRSQGGRVTPVLMPVWLITTEKEGTTYTFAINGQTGKLTCDVPADTKKSLLWGGGVFAGVFALGAVILAMMEMTDGFSLAMAGVVALLAAFIVVSVLMGELKQAVSRSEAADYIRRDSFSLQVRDDHFLYENVQRRRIETNPNPGNPPNAR